MAPIPQAIYFVTCSPEGTLKYSPDSLREAIVNRTPSRSFLDDDDDNNATQIFTSIPFRIS